MVGVRRTGGRGAEETQRVGGGEGKSQQYSNYKAEQGGEEQDKMAAEANQEGEGGLP